MHSMGCLIGVLKFLNSGCLKILLSIQYYRFVRVYKFVYGADLYIIKLSNVIDYRFFKIRFLSAVGGLFLGVLRVRGDLLEYMDITISVWSRYFFHRLLALAPSKKSLAP